MKIISPARYPVKDGDTIEHDIHALWEALTRALPKAQNNLRDEKVLFLSSQFDALLTRYTAEK